MARTQKKASKAPKAPKSSNAFNFSSMLNALEKAGVSMTQKQKSKAMVAATRASTRARAQTKFFTAPRPVVSKRTSTKRAVSKSKKANGNVSMNVAPAAAATKTKGPRVLRVKQLPHIMHSYEGKPEKANTYAHFKHLHELYDAKKNVYGFTPETNIQEVVRVLKQQDELAQSEVDELAALFGSTGL